MLNAEFHRFVVAASGSSQLMVLTGSVGRVPMMASLFRRAAAFRAGSNHQHRDILTVLRSGDTFWAEVVMRSHILAARNAVVTPA